VEPNIALPKLATTEMMEEERAWLAKAISDWLDSEWLQPDEQPVHAAIGERVSWIYARQRMEGEDDLAGILLAIGQELESFDMSNSFVGPFVVANKVAELLFSHRADGRDPAPTFTRPADGPKWSMADEVAMNEGRRETALVGFGESEARNEEAHEVPFAPTLLDKFERYIFLTELLDGTVGALEASGAVALVVGFKYDSETQAWNGADVTDPFFAKFGNTPPVNVLSNAEVLSHLDARLQENDEDGRIAEGLNLIVETYHGQVLTQILRESGDEDFKGREIVAKFLHLLGGF
jgi:hypothetical protein